MTFDPRHYKAYGLVAVLLPHDHVAVAVVAEIGHSDEGNLCAGLLQEVGGAMVAGRVVGRCRRVMRPVLDER